MMRWPASHNAGTDHVIRFHDEARETVQDVLGISFLTDVDVFLLLALPILSNLSVQEANWRIVETLRPYPSPSLHADGKYQPVYPTRPRCSLNIVGVWGRILLASLIGTLLTPLSLLVLLTAAAMARIRTRDKAVIYRLSGVSGMVLGAFWLGYEAVQLCLDIWRALLTSFFVGMLISYSGLSSFKALSWWFTTRQPSSWTAKFSWVALWKSLGQFLPLGVTLLLHVATNRAYWWDIYEERLERQGLLAGGHPGATSMGQGDRETGLADERTGLLASQDNELAAEE
ncbi:unnamed protein product [Vitrella brassicaformis CCMP3155]|uniref:Uncharacterized protein n=1 Tax=Vitrella brassicaformis (strain CCMP3155) TaxID=1169540 RepID=A0A0G4GDB2_VITBC|nr:unnamed protein product [Vitrella brassicaformis CCMP3155]|eukprot:CEM27000.1 unnamed protein product [Vitrella brassicaformis CCMP3155]